MTINDFENHKGDLSICVSNAYLIEDVFSEIDRLINLMYCDSILYECGGKFDKNTYTALKDYYREEIINHFDKIANAYDKTKIIKEEYEND